MTNDNNNLKIEHIPATAFDATAVAYRAILATMADSLTGLSINQLWPFTGIAFSDEGEQPAWHPTINISEGGKLLSLSMDVECAGELAEEFDRLLKLDEVRHARFCEQFCRHCRDGLRSEINQIREYQAVAAVLQPSRNLTAFRPRAIGSGR